MFACSSVEFSLEFDSDSVMLTNRATGYKAKVKDLGFKAKAKAKNFGLKAKAKAYGLTKASGLTLGCVFGGRKS